MSYELSEREKDLLEPPRLPGIGMSKKEIREYNVLRAIDDRASPDRRPRTGLESEASAETYRKILGKDPELVNEHRIAIPPDVLQRPNILQRDLNAATAGQGGYLVDTQNVSFVELKRNRSVVMRMGAERLPGMRGDVAIPRQSAAATAEWLTSETDPATESQQTFTQVPLTPKTCAAYTELSRQLLLQSSPAAEGVVMRDLAAVVALAVDQAAINGSGASGEPEGLLSATGVGAVTGTALDYAAILEFQSDTLGANSLINLDACGYVSTSAVASLLMQRVKFTNTDSPLWEGGMADGEVVGFKAMSSQQVPAATMIFGDWSSMLIAEWGVLEVEINPFANFPAGIVGVRAMYSVDVGLRHAASFSVASTIT